MSKKKIGNFAQRKRVGSRATSVAQTNNAALNKATEIRNREMYARGFQRYIIYIQKHNSLSF